MAQIQYGTQRADAVPLSQQSFGTQRPSNNGSHAAVPGATMVPGIGMLGPDLGGYVAGDQARQDYKLKDNADARAEEDLGIKKEQFGVQKDYLKIAQSELGLHTMAAMDAHTAAGDAHTEFGWKARDDARQQALQQGMSQAASQGGYSGVIDYLKTADPSLAIQFHAQKIKLDDALMSSDVMKALGPTEKAKALIEGYGVIGKMGSAILAAKPEDREHLFNTMQPLMKAVYGDNAPKSLEEALPQYQLAVAQSTPENILFNDQKTSMVASTELGKTSIALANMSAKGLTPANNQMAYDLNQKLIGLRADDLVAQNKLTESTAKVGALNTQKAKDEGALRAQQMAADKDMEGRYLTETKDIGEFLKQKQLFDAAYTNWSQNKGDALAKTAMVRAVAMQYNKGALSNVDVSQIAQSDSKLAQLIKNVRSSYETTGLVVLNDDEIERLRNLSDSLAKEKLPKLQQTNGRYKILEKKYNISPEAIPYYNTPEPKNDSGVKPSAIQLKTWADQAISQNPKAKDAILQELDVQLKQTQSPTSGAQ